VDAATELPSKLQNPQILPGTLAKFKKKVITITHKKSVAYVFGVRFCRAISS
jgi:hypothetical protein